MTPIDQTPRAGAPSAPADPLVGLKLVVAWAFVGIPLLWGVWHVVLNAMQLFK